MKIRNLEGRYIDSEMKNTYHVKKKCIDSVAVKLNKSKKLLNLFIKTQRSLVLKRFNAYSFSTCESIYTDLDGVLYLPVIKSLK